MSAIRTSEELKESIMKEQVYELDSSDNEKAKKILEKFTEVSNIKNKNSSVQFFTKDISRVADKITAELRKNKPV